MHPKSTHGVKYAQINDFHHLLTQSYLFNDVYTKKIIPKKLNIGGNLEL